MFPNDFALLNHVFQLYQSVVEARAGAGWTRSDGGDNSATYGPGLR